MIYRCITSFPASFSQLIETGNFLAEVLEFDKAKELYQQAFDNSDIKDRKALAWANKHRVSTQQTQYNDEFLKRLNSNKLVNELPNLDDALRRAESGFKFLSSSQSLTKQSNLQ